MQKNITFIWNRLSQDYGLLGYDNRFANFLEEPAASFCSEEVCVIFAV
jgi:hypothetical protein